jgi:hypothetical protein
VLLVGGILEVEPSGISKARFKVCILINYNYDYYKTFESLLATLSSYKTINLLNVSNILLCSLAKSDTQFRQFLGRLTCLLLKIRAGLLDGTLVLVNFVGQEVGVMDGEAVCGAQEEDPKGRVSVVKVLQLVQIVPIEVVPDLIA